MNPIHIIQQRNRELALLLLLVIGACDCEPNTIEPSTNTVDPATHEPYQRRMPKTSDLPQAGGAATPDPPSAPTEPRDPAK